MSRFKLVGPDAGARALDPLLGQSCSREGHIQWPSARAELATDLTPAPPHQGQELSISAFGKSNVLSNRRRERRDPWLKFSRGNFVNPFFAATILQKKYARSEKGGQMVDELEIATPDDTGAARDTENSMPPVRTRLLALAVALALFVATAFSPIAAAHELHHDCTGTGCTVCAELAGNLSLARGGGTAPAVVGVLITLLLISALAAIGTERSSYAPVNLISLKVRLDD